MMNINPQTGLNEARGRSPRFTLWAAFFVFNLITLGSAVQVKRGVEVGTMVPDTTRYAVICSSITFGITTIILAAHFFTTSSILFVGTMIEGAVCITLVALWTVIVSVVTDASNGLFTMLDPTGGVQNANLYYFSWAGFVSIVLITIEYGKATFGVDATGTIRNSAPRLLLWGGLLCTALIVMGSSSRIVRKECNNPYVHNESIAYCKRSRFGVAYGTLSVLVAIAVVASKVLFVGLVELSMELGAGVFVMILNTFGVGYLTSPVGPGSVVGNLYYFSWGSFLLSTMIAANCFSEYAGLSADPTIPTTDSQQPPPHGDFEIGSQ